MPQSPLHLVCTSISLMPRHLTTVRITGNETGVICWDYGDPEFGTCKETIQWGNRRMAHLLIGTFTESSVGKRCITSNLLADNNSAYSGAAFMALSYEKPISCVFILLQDHLPLTSLPLVLLYNMLQYHHHCNTCV